MRTLSLGQLSAAVAAGLILMAVGGYLLLVLPNLREADRLRAQLRQERARAGQGALERATPIIEDERRLWAALEQRLRERYPTDSELPKAMAFVTQTVRAIGMTPLSVEVLSSTVAPPGEPPPLPNQPVAPASTLFAPPPPLAPNTSTIKLVVGNHRYRELVRFVDGLATAPLYVAVRSLEVRRADSELTTEIGLASFRWAR